MNLRSSVIRLLGMGLTITTVAALVACSRPAPPQEPIRAVKVLTVGAGAQVATQEYAAEVRARVESRLGFRVGGKLLARPAEVGQRVRVGQVLAQLDPQDLKLAADAARAQVTAMRTNRDLAAADFKRYQALKDQNFISGAELERREATLQAAQAQLDQVQAQLAVQANQIAYATLTSDVAGVVTAVLAEPGQVVAAGSPVVQLAQDGTRDVVFAVPEDQVAGIRVGSAVQVRTWAGAGALPATVREVAASADPVTRTFTVKVALPPNSDLALGSTVTVVPASLQPANAQVIKLPTSALRQHGQGQATAVWVLEPASMTVRLQPIEVSATDGNEVVVTGGLTPGMQVVVTGVHVLAPGQKVTFYQGNQSLAQKKQADVAINNAANTASAARQPAVAVSAAGQ